MASTVPDLICRYCNAALQHMAGKGDMFATIGSSMVRRSTRPRGARHHTPANAGPDFRNRLAIDTGTGRKSPLEKRWSAAAGSTI
jgi:hypothetical protein